MILKGIGASSGTIEGKVKFYSKGRKFEKSEILIASLTSPEMSEQMINAGAVITEYGGFLSHASIFCRELKTPCVVGVKDLFKNVKENMRVRVNGNTGTIEIL